MRKLRRNHSAAFKARVALEAIRVEKTVAQIAAHHEVHVTQLTAWKTELLENAAAIFGGDVLAAGGKERIRELQAKIGEVTMENSSQLSNRDVSGLRGATPRNKAFRTLLRTAFRLGRPEARQPFAFFLIWTVPDRLRERLRAALGRRPRHHEATV
jgi:transposase